MCAPDFFGVEYEINPWMKRNVSQARTEIAQRQWADLCVILKERADAAVNGTVGDLGF